MQIEPRLAHISMVPGDSIKINVGISYKCDIMVKPDGTLRIYHSVGECLEI